MQHNRKSPHPNPQVATGEIAIPPFFVEFPEALQAFCNHADTLADKISRRVRQYMISYYKLDKNGKATTPLDIKKYKKKRKSHTDILKEDFGYFQSACNSW
jgi:hypothetical protein